MTRPVVISASRRTDIPAFFPDWFSRCLDAGEAVYRHPYSGRPASVPLDRERVAAFVFWTRNPRPFLPVLSRFERTGYPSLFQVTVTGFDRAVEPAAPPLGEALEAVRELSERVGPARVLWRFDPLLPGEDPEALAVRFETIASALAGAAARCTLGLAHPYRKSLRATRHIPWIWTATDRFRDAVRRVLSAGRSLGFDMRSCCSPLLEAWGAPPAPCVDGPYLRALYHGQTIPETPSPSRPGCRCTASRDIGTYRTCRHGCLYCYAA